MSSSNIRWDESYPDNDSDETSQSSAWWQEPIVVGYAFGPKKMSTMGAVMAEASRAEVIHEEQEEDFLLFDKQQQQQAPTSSAAAPELFSSPQQHLVTVPSSLTPANLEDLEKDDRETTRQSLLHHHHPQRPHTIISMGSGGDIKHIVRYFRSSCSSAAGSITETTVSTPTTATTTTMRHVPVRISFVPLDPNLALEEQHGGNFDLILHKLTEDILSIAMNNNNNNNHHEDDNHREARNRVQSLLHYKQTHDCCCLVDDPNHVQILMSRSEISKTLQTCLQDVTSASGNPVRSPKFLVVDDHNNNNNNNNSNNNNNNNTSLQEQLEEKGLQVPLIVKPLIAAGTKQSHYMTIVLQESAVHKIPHKSLIQQYVNHDSTLYKVYVLGESVHVYRRPSLPNLPPLPNNNNTTRRTPMLEFDSQRPYPRLQDFGFLESTSTEGESSSATTTPMDVTPEEVRPIVEALKQAFGLELFGFDILITQGEWLVVDVNYFPSYKEVPNFPALLAQYLTNRVLQQRRRTLFKEQQQQQQPREDRRTIGGVIDDNNNSNSCSLR